MEMSIPVVLDFITVLYAFSLHVIYTLSFSLLLVNVLSTKELQSCDLLQIDSLTKSQITLFIWTGAETLCLLLPAKYNTPSCVRAWMKLKHGN